MKKNIILFLIISIGLFLRLRIISIADLWLDEIFSVNLTKLSWYDLLFSQGEYWDFVHPPLYYILLKIWISFSDGVLWLKTLGLLFYIASSFLLYKTIHQLFSKKTAILTVLFYAVNPFIINLDIQVRMYGILSFFLIISQYLYITKILQKIQLKFFESLFIAVIFSISFFIDYGAVWFFIPIALFTFLTKEKTYIRNFFQVGLLSGLLSAYQIVFFVKITNASATAGSVPANINSDFILRELLKIFGFFDPNNLIYLLAFIACFIFIFINLASVYKKKLQMSKEHRNIFMFLLLAMFLPVLLSVLFSLTKKPIFLSRNLLYSGIVFNIVFSIIVLEIQKHAIFQKVISFFTLTILSLFLIQSLSMKNFNLLSGTPAITQRIIEKNATVIFLPKTYHNSLTQYYFPRMLSQDQQKQIYFVQNINEINELMVDENSTLFIFLFWHMRT